MKKLNIYFKDGERFSAECETARVRTDQPGVELTGGSVSVLYIDHGSVKFVTLEDIDDDGLPAKINPSENSPLRRAALDGPELYRNRQLGVC